MQLVKAERLEPKRAFRCVTCDPPPKKPRVLRRYLFAFESTDAEVGRSGEYCLPCAADFLGTSQYKLRKQVDSAIAN